MLAFWGAVCFFSFRVDFSGITTARAVRARPLHLHCLYQSMHGVIILSTSSGACLFARAFTENFGLPGKWSTHGDGEGASPTGRSFGAMQLAGLVFALKTYGEDIGDCGYTEKSNTHTRAISKAKQNTIKGSARSRGANQSKPNKLTENRFESEKIKNVKKSNRLTRYALRGVSITFEESTKHGVLVAQFANTTYGSKIPENIARNILTGFIQKHRNRFADDNTSSENNSGHFGFWPSKTLLFQEEVVEAVMAVPAEVARSIAGLADVGSTWIYVGVRGVDSVESVESVDTDSSGTHEAYKGNSQSLHGLKVGEGDGMTGNGNPLINCWSCFGRPAAARRQQRKVDDIKKRSTIQTQFVASCAPCDVSFSSATNDGWCLPLSESVLDKLVEAIGENMSCTSEGDEFTSSEFVVSGLNTFIESDSADMTRVLIFNYENCVVALPVETNGNASMSHSHPATVRGRIMAELPGLSEIMKFVDAVNPGSHGAFSGAQRR